MPTLARAPGRREIAALATLVTAGALTARPLPCLASSSSRPPSGGSAHRPDEEPRTSGGEPPPSTPAPSFLTRAEHVLELLGHIEREHGPDRAALAFLRALELSVHAIAWLPVAARAQAYGAIAVAIELLVIDEAGDVARVLIRKRGELYEHLRSHSGAAGARTDAHDRLTAVPWLVVYGAEWPELVDELLAIDDHDNPEHGLTAEMAVKLEDWLRDHERPSVGPSAPPKRDEDLEREHGGDGPPTPRSSEAHDLEIARRLSAQHRGIVIQVAPGVTRDGHPLQASFGVIEAVEPDGVIVALDDLGTHKLVAGEYRSIGRAAWVWGSIDEGREHELDELVAEDGQPVGPFSAARDDDAGDAYDELEALARIATGKEPDSDAWRTFVDTPDGRSMTAHERAALAAMLWPNGPPSSRAYALLLEALRSCVERDEGSLGTLATTYLARIADEENDGEISAHFFARCVDAPNGLTYGAALAAHVEAAGVDSRTAAVALARGLVRACSMRWKSGVARGAVDRELAGLHTGLAALLDGAPREEARRKACADGMPGDDLDAILGSLANHLLEEGHRGAAWFLVVSTFEVLSHARNDDEELLRAVMLRSIEALALERAWGARC